MNGTHTQPADESTAIAAPDRRRRSRLAGILALIFVLLGLGLWWATPWLVPPLADRYLPEGWAIEAADIDRPGLQQAGLKSIRLKGRLAGFDITVEMEGASWRYADRTLRAERVRVHAVPAPVPAAGAASEFRFPEDLALPRLVLPTPDASVQIDRLDLAVGEGDAALDATVQDLRLGGEGDQLVVDAELPPNDTVREASRLELAWGASSFLLDWTTAKQPMTPALRIQQAVTSDNGNAAGTGATGLVQLDLDLTVLDPALLNPLAERLGLESPMDAAGQLFVVADLVGDQALAPTALNLTLEGLRLASGETELELDLVASATRESAGTLVEVSSLALRNQGPLPPLNDSLVRLLADLPVDGLDAGAPLGFAVSAPLDIKDGVTARFEDGQPLPTQVDGSFRIDARLDDSTVVSATVPALSWRAPDGSPSLDAREVQVRLRQDDTLIYRMESGDAGFSAAEVSATGDLVVGEDGARFTGRLDAGTFSDVSVAQSGVTARLRTLGLSGPLTVGAGMMNFEGEVGGAGLVVAPAEAVAASSLLVADSLAFRLDASGVDSTRITGQGSLNGVALPDLGVTLDGIDLDIGSLRLPTMDGTLTALTRGLEVTLEETRYRGMDLDVEGALAQGRILEGNGSLLLGFSGEIPFRYVMDLERPTLEATLENARLGADALPAAARALAVTLPESLSFLGGTLNLDGRIAYVDDRLGGALQVQGDALALGLGESRFEGLDFTTEVDVADVISGRGPLALELANLAAGLDLTLLSTSVEFQGADLGLISLDAQLLGGQLRTPGLRLAGGQLQGTLIEWTGFDLGKLLTFVDVNGLDGTGTLDATFPIVNDGGGPAVEAGRFAARGPGVLRYSSGVPATNIGLQALENFQYESLEGQLDYANDGAYTIALDLLGRNPDLYGGHPVRFRLNLGGEMPALFRSLFITGDFDKAIIERLRAGEPALPETGATPVDETP